MGSESYNDKIELAILLLWACIRTKCTSHHEEPHEKSLEALNMTLFSPLIHLDPMSVILI